MTRKKLNSFGWILFGLGVVLASFTGKAGVIALVAATLCFLLAGWRSR